MMPAIRLGVIGAGSAFEKLHWPVLKRMPRAFAVRAVASRTRERAESAAVLAGGADAYDDYRRILDDPQIDAVLTAVPIHANHAVLLDAIRAGKHVMAEKPLAATSALAALILQELRSDRVVAVAENFRYRPDLAAAREAIARGVVGEPFAFQLNVLLDLDAPIRRVWTEKPWRRDPGYPGGFLLDAGIHAVAFLQDLLGDVCEVSASTLNRHPSIGGPDTLLMQAVLENGVRGQFFACYTAKAKRETPLRVSVYGSKGTLEIAPGRVGWSGEIAGAVRVSRQDRGYARQWTNFREAILGKAPLISTPERADRDLRVVEAALQSAISNFRFVESHSLCDNINRLY